MVFRVSYTLSLTLLDSVRSRESSGPVKENIQTCFHEFSSRLLSENQHLHMVLPDPLQEIDINCDELLQNSDKSDISAKKLS